MDLRDRLVFGFFKLNKNENLFIINSFLDTYDLFFYYPKFETQLF